MPKHIQLSIHIALCIALCIWLSVVFFYHNSATTSDSFYVLFTLAFPFVFTVHLIYTSKQLYLYRIIIDTIWIVYGVILILFNYRITPTFLEDVAIYYVGNTHNIYQCLSVDEFYLIAIALFTGAITHSYRLFSWSKNTIHTSFTKWQYIALCNYVIIAIICFSIILPAVTLTPDETVSNIGTSTIPLMAINTKIPLLFMYPLIFITGIILFYKKNKITTTKDSWIIEYTVAIFIVVGVLVSRVMFLPNGLSVVAGFIKADIQYHYFINDIYLFSIPILYVICLGYTLWSKRVILVKYEP